jgi:hypothetical protein
MSATAHSPPTATPQKSAKAKILLLGQDAEFEKFDPLLLNSTSDRAEADDSSLQMRKTRPGRPGVMESWVETPSYAICLAVKRVL